MKTIKLIAGLLLAAIITGCDIERIPLGESQAFDFPVAVSENCGKSWEMIPAEDDVYDVDTSEPCEWQIPLPKNDAVVVKNFVVTIPDKGMVRVQYQYKVLNYEVYFSKARYLTQPTFVTGLAVSPIASSCQKKIGKDIGSVHAIMQECDIEPRLNAVIRRHIIADNTSNASGMYPPTSNVKVDTTKVVEELLQLQTDYNVIVVKVIVQ